MTTTFRTHFTFRVDTWTPDGESIVERQGLSGCALFLLLGDAWRRPESSLTLFALSKEASNQGVDFLKRKVARIAFSVVIKNEREWTKDLPEAAEGHAFGPVRIGRLKWLTA